MFPSVDPPSCALYGVATASAVLCLPEYCCTAFWMEVSLQLGSVCNVADQQKQFRATREHGIERLWLREISLDPGDARQSLCSAGIVDERARRHARVREQPQDFASNLAGAAGDENHGWLLKGPLRSAGADRSPA